MDSVMPDHAPDLIGFYRGLLAADPAQPGIAAPLAAALLDGGDPGAALEVVQATGAAQDPALAVAHGRALKALGRFEPAADAFAHAVAQGADMVSVLVALGNCLAEAGRLDEACGWFEGAAGRDASGLALANLAAARARLGQATAAIAAARAALVRDPDMINAHRTLAVLLAAHEPDAALLHRTAAFGRQAVFSRNGPPGAPRVLVLTCVAAASLPIDHLLPRSRYTLVEWFIDHADGTPLELPPCDVVFNAIGEPALMPPITAIVRLVLAGGLKVLNPPDRVLRTGRAGLPALLAGIEGLVVPAVARVGDVDDAAAIGLPALIRPVGSHGGEGLRLVETGAALEAARAAMPDALVTRYVDYRSADGFYRKYRMIFVDGVVYPYHLAIGPDWMVHYWTAGMATDARRREEEARFLADPVNVLGPGAAAAIGSVARRLDLDYAGIDFSILADGRVLVFEANAAMLVHPEHEPVFAYRNPAVARILDACHAMIRRRCASIAESDKCAEGMPDEEQTETDQAGQEPDAEPVGMQPAP